LSGPSPDRRPELADGSGEVALLGDERGPRRGQRRLGQRHVGARGLAHLEPLLRGPQLLGDEPHVVLAQLHEATHRRTSM
jgi:hypothetical protein